MTVLQITLAGLAGTAFMTLIMTLVHRAQWANGDMVRALGSLATGSLDRAVPAGLAIHAVSGVLFAVPYVFLLGYFAPDHSLSAATIGAVLGLLHGIVVSLILIAAVSDRHPVAKFRGAGFEVAAAHLAGHIGYGFGVGLAYAALHITLV